MNFVFSAIFMHTYFKFSIFYYLKQFLRSKISFILAYCARFRHTKQKDFRILRYIQGCIFIVVTLEISIAIISTFSLMATHHFLWIHQLRELRILIPLAWKLSPVLICCNFTYFYVALWTDLVQFIITKMGKLSKAKKY